MSNARTHRDKAERLLDLAERYDLDVQADREKALIALGKAQVHAALASSKSAEDGVRAQIEAVNASTKALSAKVHAAAEKGYLAGATARRKG